MKSRTEEGYLWCGWEADSGLSRPITRSWSGLECCASPHIAFGAEFGARRGLLNEKGATAPENREGRAKWVVGRLPEDGRCHGTRRDLVGGLAPNYCRVLLRSLSPHHPPLSCTRSSTMSCVMKPTARMIGNTTM